MSPRRRLRFVVRIWKRFGIIGIAVLTPPFLTPPIGAAIAVSFGEKVSRIILFLGASMVAWSLVFAFFGEWIAGLLH